MNGKIKNIAVYFIIPAAIAFLVIIKVFFFADCFAFDSNDDANHTFPNLFISRSILRDGEIPMMNLYNNFGTPILGDAITYPFALQSLTYYFLPNYMAMTVNRAVIGFLTVLALTLYFKKYLSLGISSLCAVLVYLSPGFLWHSAHHHYQLALLCFTLLIIFQERFNDTSRLKHLFLFYLSIIAASLSTSVNLIFLIVPFLIMNQFFLSGAKIDKKMILILIAISSGLLFYYPEFLNFLQSVKTSVRVGQGYEIPSYTFQRLFSGMLGQQEPWRHHDDSAVYFPLSIITLSIAGIISIFKKYHKKNIHFPLRLAILGIAPIFAVLILLRFPQVFWSIPLMKSTDITRVWWLSNIFLMISVGTSLEKIIKNGYSKKFFTVLLIGFGVVLLGCVYLLNWERIDLKYKLPVFFFLFLTFLTVVYHATTKVNPRKHIRSHVYLIFCGLFGASLVWSQMVMAANILNFEDWSECCIKKEDRHYNTHHFSNTWQASFQPEELLDVMTPNSRMVSEITSGHGHDLKAVENYILGSNARSVLVDKGFTDFLLKEKMIEIDQSPLAYHFIGPWNLENVNRFGIKYIFTGPRTELIKKGWRVVSPIQILLIFKNPEPVSIVYLQNGSARTWIDTESIKIKGNGLKVKLPPVTQEQELIATFLNLKGWKATVNNRRRHIYSREDRFIRLKVKPGDRFVSIRYEPFNFYQVLLGVLASPIVFLLGVFGLTKENVYSKKQ